MKRLAIDNETFLITRERPFPPVVCVAWADGRASAVMPHNGTARERVEAWLADPDQGFVGHNIAYDFGTIAASWPELLPAIFDAYKAGRVTDTMIRQQLFDIATGRTLADDGLKTYGLAALFKLCFDRDMAGGPKSSILDEPTLVRYRYGELYDVDFSDWPDEAVEYARTDAESTIAIFNEQERAAHLLRDDAFQTYSAFTLALTSAQGMRTDPDRVAAFRAEQTAIMRALEPELIAAGLLEADRKGHLTKKTRPAQERILAACVAQGVEPMLTDSGIKIKQDGGTPGLEHLSIDRTACHWAQDPLMLRRAEYVTAEKMLSTYVPFLEAGVDGPVTSRFNLAATGRTTSSTPREPAVGGNQQNAPRRTKRIKPGTESELEDSKLGVRECFAPRPGRVFLSGDFSGAELHGVSQVCKWRFGYSVLGETLKSGKDAHLYLSTYLLGGDARHYDDVVARYKQGDPAVINARQEAKPGNFGFWGAMGVTTFRKTQLREGRHWTHEAATNLRAAWLEAWPEAAEYFEAGKQELGPKGRAVVEFYWSKRLRKVQGLSTICNGFFQAIVADGAKKACNEVIRLCFVGGPSSALWLSDTRPVNFVHDELITETKLDEPARMAPAVREFSETLQNEFNELVPDFPTKVEAVLSFKLSKRAKSVYNAEGYLVPWLD